MEWNTPVSIDLQQGAVTHHHRMMLFGSCFAEHIGTRLGEFHFRVDVNPFGIQYNPLSIAQSLVRLLDRKPFSDEDLFSNGNLWHSFAHHSSFSHIDKALCLQQINRRFLPASTSLGEVDFLILTWGTAWVYTLTGTDTVVANCHKLPDGCCMVTIARTVVCHESPCEAAVYGESRAAYEGRCARQSIEQICSVAFYR